jgi:hypothetical protein
MFKIVKMESSQCTMSPGRVDLSIKIICDIENGDAIENFIIKRRNAAINCNKKSSVTKGCNNRNKHD